MIGDDDFGGDDGDIGNPHNLPAQFIGEDGAVNVPELVKSYNEAAALKAQHDERISKLPQKPEDYAIEVKLLDTVQLPDGVEIKIDEKDPRIPMVRALAHRHHLPQQAVNELVALEAQHQIESDAAADAAFQAEIGKLGEKGTERLQAVQVALKANVSKDEYEALRPYITTAAAVSAIEKLMGRIAGSRQAQPQRRLADQPAHERWYSNGNNGAKQ